MYVQRAELPSEWEHDYIDAYRKQRGDATKSEEAVCFDVRGACTCWAYYPWYMQAGYVLSHGDLKSELLTKFLEYT